MYSIQLIKPKDNSTTKPLQLHCWPDGHIPENGTVDWSRPCPVEFAWEAVKMPGDHLRYVLVVGLDGELSVVRRVEGLKDRFARVVNLYVGRCYYWKVEAWSSNEKIAESPVWSFSTHPTPPRWIEVPGITNARDIGGWELPNNRRIRQGLVFRSSEMNSHLFLTEEGKRILEEELEIRTDVDLRGEDEICQPALDKDRVAYFNFPVQPYEHIAESKYQQHYRGIFQLLADPRRYPVIIHCWGGADRTGTVVFLLQALLGMEKELLTCEYELTSLSIWGERIRTSVEFQEFLQTLARYSPRGSSLQTQVESYLETIGVSAAEMASIRAMLMEG